MFTKRIICKICKSKKVIGLLSRNFSDCSVAEFFYTYYETRIPPSLLQHSSFKVIKCTQCGFIWQKNILNGGLTQKLYDKWIDPVASLAKRKEAGIKQYKKYAAEAQRISTFFDKKPFEIDVLDFGMGWGYWCFMAKAHGYNIWGLEFAKNRIEYAKNNCISVIEDENNLQQKKFDFINAEQVIEHIPDPLEQLKKLVSLLKKGGVIHIAVPDGSDIEKKLTNPDWHAEHDAIHPLEHINCFTPKTLISLAQKAGLKPITIKEPLSIKSVAKKLLGKTTPPTTNMYFIKQ